MNDDDPEPDYGLTLPVLLVCGLLSLPIWGLIAVLLWSVLRSWNGS